MRFLLVFWVTLVACGQVNPAEVFYPQPAKQPVAPNVIDKDLLPFVQQFENDAKKAGKVLFEIRSISFKDGPLHDKPSVLGVCYSYESGPRWIDFSSYWWAQMSDTRRKHTVYHEMGHCGLARKHYDKWFMVGDLFYQSIMNPYISFENDENEETEWPVLVDELFHPDQYHNTELHGQTLVEDDCFVTPEGYTACPLIYGKASQ